ncbi:MAG TPA: hypothetical protein VJH21_01955 [Candidatus Paceibacterota bacterium]
MFGWIFLVVFAQFLNAIVAIVDKYIVSSPRMLRPFVYAFYVSALSSLSVFIFFLGDITIPFTSVSFPSFHNVVAPTMVILSISFVAGIMFFGALVTLFSALKRADASDVIPVAGATSAVSALLLSTLLLNASLTVGFAWGFLLLVIGTLILSFFHFSLKTLLFSVSSGFMFGAHFISLKLLFVETTFDDAFFWSRFGIVTVALLVFLFLPHHRRQCISKSKEAGHKLWGLIIGNKILAGLGSIMLLKATQLGDVSIIQALGGLQFVYLLSFTVLFGKDLPQICGEKCSRRQLIQKSIAVSIIVVGFFILFLE